MVHDVVKKCQMKTMYKSGIVDTLASRGLSASTRQHNIQKLEILQIKEYY